MNSSECYTRLRKLFVVVAALGFCFPVLAQPKPDATKLLQASFDNWRGQSSRAEVTMVVHRPEWERSLTMTSWTKGNDHTLARFTAPAKDAGNATLKLDNTTYVFNPKLNQVVKLPASLLSRSWMGSDFSYNDLAKADDILTQYTHQLTGNRDKSDHVIYQIEALPKPGAPVVWGKLVAEVRDDGILVKQSYFDQDMQLVRTMITDRIDTIGGRKYPVEITMRPQDKPEQWTKIKTVTADFNIEIPAYIFTRSNLQNSRGN